MTCVAFDPNDAESSPGFGHNSGELALGHVLGEGDVPALSGSVPFSWAYGAPVV